MHIELQQDQIKEIDEHPNSVVLQVVEADSSSGDEPIASVIDMWRDPVRIAARASRQELHRRMIPASGASYWC